jgi:hypothetical protein
MMLKQRFHARNLRLWSLGLLATTAAASSCADSARPSVPAAGSPASHEGATVGGSGASGESATVGGSGAMPSGGTLNLDGSMLVEPAGGGGAPDLTTISRDDACAESSEIASALPSILQLVVDTSGSMDWPPGWAPKTPDDSKPPGATKWEITRDALLSAVAALPADVALGVNFFPNVEQMDTTCLLDHVALPIGLLGKKGSNARAAWQAAVADVVPVGATPTHGAYRFGLTLLTASSLPGNKFILLITDGTPTCTLDCQCTENNLPVDSQPLITEAVAALADGVRTFVIGSPGSEDARDVLSQLASEGGTAKAGCSDSGPSYCHFDMTREADLGGALSRTLDEISKSLRSCEYPIPPPPAGQMLDPDRVNVLYTPGPSAATETVPRDPSPSACGEGWQYSADGTSIVLCGAACARAQSDVGSSVELLFGCQTVVEKPK